MVNGFRRRHPSLEEVAACRCPDGSDWVRNILAAGQARLTIAGKQLDLTAPRSTDGDEAWQVLGDRVKRPPGVLRITEYLRMDLSDR